MQRWRWNPRLWKCYPLSHMPTHSIFSTWLPFLFPIGATGSAMSRKDSGVPAASGCPALFRSCLLPARMTRVPFLLTKNCVRIGVNVLRKKREPHKVVFLVRIFPWVSPGWSHCTQEAKSGQEVGPGYKPQGLPPVTHLLPSTP